MSKNTSRRTFLGQTANLGFALAVQPISATTILTERNSLQDGNIKIDIAGEALPAYFVQPIGNHAALPIVLVIQEIFGVHEHIRDICRRLAQEGYLAVAPELYFRQGDPSKVANIDELVSGIVSQVADSQVKTDLDATLNWAAQHAGDIKRAAITGFCWGGRQVWLYAAHNPALKAGVAWYGKLEGKASPQTPYYPIELASELQAPVLGLYGGQDKGISLESVDRMKAALQATNKPSEIIVYPNAGHGFNADYRPSYDATAAQDGWQRMLAWFKANGV
ncbi:dienelactone hydrolase family protein [Neisseriaceae bacterium TC5R-5]|nr:dienelactone hydrolase family protein [Neisseriaceae bacterium TC5R-5]